MLQRLPNASQMLIMLTTSTSINTQSQHNRPMKSFPPLQKLHISINTFIPHPQSMIHFPAKPTPTSPLHFQKTDNNHITIYQYTHVPHQPPMTFHIYQPITKSNVPQFTYPSLHNSLSPPRPNSHTSKLKNLTTNSQLHNVQKTTTTHHAKSSSTSSYYRRNRTACRLHLRRAPGFQITRPSGFRRDPHHPANGPEDLDPGATDPARFAEDGRTHQCTTGPRRTSLAADPGRGRGGLTRRSTRNDQNLQSTIAMINEQERTPTSSSPSRRISSLTSTTWTPLSQKVTSSPNLSHPLPTPRRMERQECASLMSLWHQ